jgi:putative pyrroloquinoline-quinone binding quinoprotein
MNRIPGTGTISYMRGPIVKRIVLVCCLVCLPRAVFAQAPLLWELQQDLGGGVDMARAITLSGRAAVIVGNGGVPLEGTDESDLVIEALRRSAGAVRWKDQTFLSVGAIEPLFLATRNNRAYVVGTLREPNDVRSAFLVRAYDVPTGTFLWQNVWHAGQGVDTDHPTGVFASPTAVVVVGYSENATHDGLATVVRAYNPVSGAILWEDRVGSTGVDMIGWTIAGNRKLLFVAGAVSLSQTSNPSPPDLFVRAYDAASGSLVWEFSRQSITPTKLVLASGRLIIAGAAANSTYLAAFSASSGTLFWQDTVPMTNGIVADVAVSGFRIATAINSGEEFAVRSYDLTTGILQWEERSGIRPGFHEHASAVGVNDNALFVAGDSGQDFGNSDFMVRAFDASSGATLWEDHSHSSAQTSAVDLALGKVRLFVAGYTTNTSTSADFLIRAYDIRPKTTATH